jgi:hypothetical protein
MSEYMGNEEANEATRIYCKNGSDKPASLSIGTYDTIELCR